MAGKFAVPLLETGRIYVFACVSQLLQFTYTLHYCQLFSKPARMWFTFPDVFYSITNHSEHVLAFISVQVNLLFPANATVRDLQKLHCITRQ